jgi:3-methyladenine DNA glycosylase/8-oxoguanine DNA glycosylase
VIQAELRPQGPYSLRLSGRLSSDATRVVANGTYRTTIAADGRLERVFAWQRPDGGICVRADSEAGVEHVRFALGLDDDHSEFLQRFADDPMIGEATRRLRGLRPLRTATVAQSLLRAVCGQLIQASRAREIERAVIRATTPSHAGLHAAPTPADLGRFAPAQLAAFGLGGRRATALVRLCRAFDVERLRGVPTDAAARRLERERGLGPWSIGVICLQGLGRFERGLARDLGLVKLMSAMRGRWVEAEETDELLVPYGDWAGLASVYLLAGHAAGLVGLTDAHRDPGRGQDRRVPPRRAA